MSGIQVTLVLDRCTDVRMDKHEFIGRFRLKPGIQKCKSIERVREQKHIQNPVKHLKRSFLRK